MFPRKGQVEVTVLIFAILFFVLAFSFNLDQIESKVTEGIGKTSQVIYDNYEVKERFLSHSNYVRMQAYSVSESLSEDEYRNICNCSYIENSTNISSKCKLGCFNDILLNFISEKVNYTDFDTELSRNKCSITFDLSISYENTTFEKEESLEIPECL